MTQAEEKDESELPALEKVPSPKAASQEATLAPAITGILVRTDFFRQFYASKIARTSFLFEIPQTSFAIEGFYFLSSN